MSKIDDIIMEFASNYLEFNADDVFDYCQTREKTTLPYIRKVLMRLVNNGKLIRPNPRHDINHGIDPYFR